MSTELSKEAKKLLYVYENPSLYVSPYIDIQKIKDEDDCLGEGDGEDDDLYCDDYQYTSEYTVAQLLRAIGDLLCPPNWEKTGESESVAFSKLNELANELDEYGQAQWEESDVY